MTDKTQNTFNPTASEKYVEPKTKQPNLTELMVQYIKQCAVGEV